MNSKQFKMLILATGSLLAAVLVFSALKYLNRPNVFINVRAPGLDGEFQSVVIMPLSEHEVPSVRKLLEKMREHDAKAQEFLDLRDRHSANIIFLKRAYNGTFMGKIKPGPILTYHLDAELYGYFVLSELTQVLFVSLDTPEHGIDLGRF